MIASITGFSVVSNLRPNPTKSSCFFCNVPSDIIDEVINSTGFQRGSFPITYLGLPLITSRLKTQDCSALINRLCSRIENWTARSLRFSGRLLLIKYVLFSIQGYWASYLFLPTGVLDKIQSLFAKFLWGFS